MSEDKDQARRSEMARTVFHRFRARTYASGAYPTARSQASFHAGKSRAPAAADREAPPLHDESDESQTPNAWVAPPGVYRSKTGPGRSRWDPQTIGDVLDIEARRRGWEQTLEVASVTGDWEKIVGPHIAEHCPIESFEGGTLVARADSTAWAQQLQLLLPHIHKRIDERVGAGVVDKVVVLPPRGPSWAKGKRTYRGGRGPRDTYG